MKKDFRISRDKHVLPERMQVFGSSPLSILCEKETREMRFRDITVTVSVRFQEVRHLAETEQYFTATQQARNTKAKGTEQQSGCDLAISLPPTL